MQRPARDPSWLLAMLIRWQRARVLTLAVIVGVGLTTLPAPLGALLDALVPPTEPDRISGLDRSPHREGRLLLIPVSIEEPDPILEPRIEKRNGRWIARDVLGTSAIELAIDEDPVHAEAKLIAWARSICDGFPRELYLVGPQPRVGSHDTAWIWEPLARRLEHACPTFAVYQVVLVSYPH